MELMFVENFHKLDFKQVSFLTVGKCWSKYLCSCENYADASRPSCWGLVQYWTIIFQLAIWGSRLHSSEIGFCEFSRTIKISNGFSCSCWSVAKWRCCCVSDAALLRAANSFKFKTIIAWICKGPCSTWNTITFNTFWKFSTLYSRCVQVDTSGICAWLSSASEIFFNECCKISSFIKISLFCLYFASLLDVFLWLGDFFDLKKWAKSADCSTTDAKCESNDTVRRFFLRNFNLTLRIIWAYDYPKDMVVLELMLFQSVYRTLTGKCSPNFFQTIVLSQ